MKIRKTHVNRIKGKELYNGNVYFSIGVNFKPDSSESVDLRIISGPKHSTHVTVVELDEKEITDLYAFLKKHIPKYLPNVTL